MKNATKKIPALISGGRNFLTTDLWRIRLKDLEGKKGFSVRSLRILLVAASKFISDQCPLRSSALTFYSLLSIVPVMAMAFAVAKGFGVQNMLEKELLEQFAGQQEIINRIIEYARAMLEQTRGGLLAGISAAALIWAALKVMDNIERSLNDIWAAAAGRPLRKKFSDYLAILLISPLLLIMSGSATVLIISRITMITEKVAVLGIFSPVIMGLLKLLPYGVIWILFTFIYVFMPNIRVAVKSGLIGGIVAGTAFKLLQWAYIYFQVGVSRYNAIYGSFAALPLFLIWLELSWLIVLFGAELSFAHQNVDEYELAPDSRNISDSLKKSLSLSVLHLMVKAFQRGDRPLTDREISEALDIPIRLVKSILSALSAGNQINRTECREGAASAWQPARDINTITVAAVLEALDKSGVNELPVERSREFDVISGAVNAVYDAVRNSPANVALKDI
ncbi:MAG: YhjD/YihY/BrkB family envelope integrity protein [Thermodesulfobacteriota bacterium]